MSACLANCSNQGICVLNSLQQYICACNEYKTGKACQTDSRPCSSNPCLNNGTCSNIILSNNQTSFECSCQNPSVYYGIYCQNKFDLCLNNTEICIEGQGFCIVNDTQPMCKCFKYFTGTKCEIMSTSLIMTKAIINISSIIAIAVLVSFIILVLCLDFTKFMGKKKPYKKPRIKKFKHQT